MVGEDLGTVEPGVRERLAAEGVLSYRLAWFEHGPDGGRRRAADYPRLALAATTTHDLPTVAGFFTGSDLEHLCDIGVATPGGGAGRPGGAAGQPVPAAGGRGPAGAGRAVGRGDRGRPLRLPRPDPGMLVAATLEDAVEAPDRPNVPGTIDQRPNWSLPLPVPLDDLAADPRVRRLAGILSKGRTGRRTKLRGSLRESAARAGYDHRRNLHLAGQATALGGRAT